MKQSWISAWAILVLLTLAATAKEAEKPKPAQLKISGYRLFGNIELKRLLRTLDSESKTNEFLNASFVEDAAMLLAARVQQDGYLSATVLVEVTLDDGTVIRATGEELLENPLPRPARIKAAHFLVRKGPLYYYRELEITGMQPEQVQEPLAYFIETGPLLKLKRARVFTPDRLERGKASLKGALGRKGFRDAKIDVTSLERDDQTGAVDVRLHVDAGVAYVVHSVREEVFVELDSSPGEIQVIHPGKPYSTHWVQDFTQSIKTNFYHRGYPDVAVGTEVVKTFDEGGKRMVDLVATIKTGPKVLIGKVSFKGEERTQPSVMARQVRIKEGELLDPSKVEKGRFRLSGLGIFDSVSVNYEPVDTQTRGVTYVVDEGKFIDVSLLFGWGSYELLRGGVVTDFNNLWGSAHHAQLKLVQSFKSSNAEFRYTVPDLWSRDFDLFLHGSFLRREEISFTREEYGGGVGVHKYFRPIATDLSLHYTYQILNALDLVPAVSSVGPTNPAVGSITLDAKFDRRDNPLYPRKGYRVFLTAETASEQLAGEVNYERLTLTASWHLRLASGLWLGLGVSHGAAISFGSSVENLPFDKRFFPGGGSSIRGYTEGEASPRNAKGDFVGAETYTLGTIELERELAPKWSLIVFSDSLGYAQSLSDYPFNAGLFSVGGGIRWRTIIGPVRLEYGYNLNPRPKDPHGTLQFSLGFPF